MCIRSLLYMLLEHPGAGWRLYYYDNVLIMRAINGCLLCVVMCVCYVIICIDNYQLLVVNIYYIVYCPRCWAPG